MVYIVCIKAFAYRWQLPVSPTAFRPISLFINDDASASVLQQLEANGIRMLSLRSAGFNHVDLTTAKTLNLSVARVPAYSPYSVAEYTIGLILTLNRKLHQAYARVREQNFFLNGLLGFDLHGKTIGIIGAGRIGSMLARIMIGFGCQVLAIDPDSEPGMPKSRRALCYIAGTAGRE